MLAWWCRRSRKAKVRLVFYPGRVLILAGFGWYTSAGRRWPMPGRSFRGALPEATEREKALAGDLRRDVDALTSIGSRNTARAGTLDRGAELAEQAFVAGGYATKRMPYDVEGAVVANVEATLAGTSKKQEIVLVGAHYDSVPGTVGADDNASGVAAMLALARAFARKPLGRTLRFVAFVNEEWIKERAEAVLQLRCIDANGDWHVFVDRVHKQARHRASSTGDRVRLQQRVPPPLPTVEIADAACRGKIGTQLKS